MKYKDLGQGVFATMLLTGATVMLLVSGGNSPEQKRTYPVQSSLPAEIRQQASDQLQRTSVEQGLRPFGSEKSSWVF
ncbi:hypothetical protein DT594_01260 [Halopseudomonas laoshanensis]|uniref:Uncharacterized protein n=1 Tax=Halopseudomonas laoshanensis TaxID=2268758 RepID=A0A7V7GVE7_9GAMM|nr:hypothetical protein [Halopseudomonas laoshanensis]KAA0696022.1 hypothetical protein DT594_01260 [Halopseudomonas laoshanensis]WOD10187.1 hypothetical protein RPW65_14115 [Pseudomonas sp. NyZ704]